jgi:hypothetical protein
LLFFVLYFIIIQINNNLSAQEKKPRDPFLSLGDKIKLSQETKDTSVLPYPIVVNGIIWTEHLPVAIINNEIIQEGEVWRDFKVEKIEKDKIILSRGKSQFEIPWVSEEENDETKAKTKKD